MKRFERVVVHFIVYLSTVVFCFSQTKPLAVDLDLECQVSQQYRFRLSNRTRWAISVPTEKIYFSSSSDNGRRPRTTSLDLGGSVFVLPEDKPIDSILYFVEREISRSPYPIRETVTEGIDSFNHSWISKESSIFFFVDKKDLSEKSRIFVKFNYEWELNKQGVFVGGLNEHIASLSVGTILDRLEKCR